ncbi:MAG TPA: hypothetical protein VNE42_05010 [Acidimicrobiales bacterium]|nr:hypothetical protein [Acidimicrobiales bacterium]
MKHIRLSTTKRLASTSGIALAVMLGASAAPGLGSTIHPDTALRANVVGAKIISFRGVVVARNIARHSLVVSSPTGIVHTVRFTQANEVSAVRIGSDVISRSIALGDGTFHSKSLKRLGQARRAMIRGTVVRNLGKNILLSAGGSVFAIRDRLNSTSKKEAGHSQSKISLTGSGLVPGDVIEATVSYNEGTTQESQGQLSTVQQLGQTGIIGIDGVLSSINTGVSTSTSTGSITSATSITIAVDQGALTTVSIPPSISLPSTIAVGDRVEVIASYANQAFSLITIKDDSLAASEIGQGTNQSGNLEDQTVESEGYVVTANATTLVVQPGDGASSVSFTIPTTLTVPTLNAGALVHAKGTLVNGVLTLTSVIVQQPEDDQGSGTNLGNTEVSGTVSTMTVTSMTIQPTGTGAAVTFAIPTGFLLKGVVTGGAVDATGTLVSGVLTLAKAQVPDRARVNVSGTITTLNSTTLIVMSSDTGLPTTFTVPTDFSFGTFAVNAKVSAKGTLVGSVPALTSIALND